VIRGVTYVLAQSSRPAAAIGERYRASPLDRIPASRSTHRHWIGRPISTHIRWALPPKCRPHHTPELPFTIRSDIAPSLHCRGVLACHLADRCSMLFDLSLRCQKPIPPCCIWRSLLPQSPRSPRRSTLSGGGLDTQRLRHSVARPEPPHRRSAHPNPGSLRCLPVRLH